MQIRKVIKITGGAIALLVGVGIPLGYTVHEFLHARQHMFWKAERSAEQIAEYASKSGPLWPYNRLRLEEILARRSDEDNDSRQRIVNADGNVIFAEEHILAWPIFTGRAPIRVAENTIGWIEADESQLPLLMKIGVLAAISGRRRNSCATKLPRPTAGLITA